MTPSPTTTTTTARLRRFHVLRTLLVLGVSITGVSSSSISSPNLQQQQQQQPNATQQLVDNDNNHNSSSIFSGVATNASFSTVDNITASSSNSNSTIRTNSSTVTTYEYLYENQRHQAPQWMVDFMAFRQELFLKTVEPVIVFLLGPLEDAAVEDEAYDYDSTTSSSRAWKTTMMLSQTTSQTKGAATAVKTQSESAYTYD